VNNVTIGKLRVDGVTFDQAVETLEDLVRRGEGGAVFTPNVDHVVLAEDNPRMRTAYARAELCLADGMPLLWASRLLGQPLPAKVSGSDFVPAVLERAAQRGFRVYFLGGSPGIAARARDKLRETLPSLEVVGVDAPQIEVDDSFERREAIAARIRASGAHLVFVALGAPKQEIFIDQVRDSLRPCVLLAVGGSLDFVAGAIPRAPRWISRAGLEWMFRLSREPRRLWRRYLLRDPKFLMVVARNLREHARSSSTDAVRQ
jgi:N-acetylglucosaminyldiphosphoundecaprenol N-acetyl-beta-D-mannosaminyltransferase